VFFTDEVEAIEVAEKMILSHSNNNFL